MVSFLIDRLDVRGGTQKQLLRLSEFLLKEKIAFEIIARVYDPELSYPEFKELPIKFLRKTPRRAQNRLIKRLFSIYEDILMMMMITASYRILNVHDNGFPLLIVVYRLLGKKIIFQVNDLPSCFLEGVSQGRNDSVGKMIARFMYKTVVFPMVGEVTVNSSKNRDLIQKHFKRKANLFYCGVDFDSGLQPRMGMKNKNCIKILTTGVFFPYRNYETLLDVVKKILSVGIEVHLNIVGSTRLDVNYAKKIHSLVERKNLAESVHIWDQVDDKVLMELKKDSDVFVFININQSWGLAIFEAMSAGLPVIVSNSVGAVELLEDGKNALIVDPTNVLQIAEKVLDLRNNNVYAGISERGYKLALSLSWDDAYSSKMLRLFKELN